MIHSVTIAINQIADRLNRLPAAAPEVLAPGLILCALWPLLRVAFASEVEAFMIAFAVMVALRLAIRAEVLILTARRLFSARLTAAVILAAGPGALAFLLLNGDPIWCQRFLSLYFALMTGLWLLDVIDGRAAMAERKFPNLSGRALTIASQSMTLFYMGLLLANETIIAHSNVANWMLFFGFMPLISHLVTTALQQRLHFRFDAV